MIFIFIYFIQVKTAMSLILGQENSLGTINDSAVLQEFLRGVEHVVDTVSLDGIHKVCRYCLLIEITSPPSFIDQIDFLLSDRGCVAI